MRRTAKTRGRAKTQRMPSEAIAQRRVRSVWRRSVQPSHLQEHACAAAAAVLDGRACSGSP